MNWRKFSALDGDRVKCYFANKNQTQKKSAMANDVEINPRYLKYDKADVERLLGEVENMKPSSEESVRSIVKDWMQDAESEPGE